MPTPPRRFLKTRWRPWTSARSRYTCRVASRCRQPPWKRLPPSLQCVGWRPELAIPAWAWPRMVSLLLGAVLTGSCFLAAVYVTGRGPALREPTILQIDANALEQRRVEPCADGRKVHALHALCHVMSVCMQLVSCGVPGPGVGVAIVDPDTLEETGGVGEIWISGPSKAQGYWGKTELSRETFKAKLHGTEYLRAGDLGFLHEGEVFVCGRLKDLIIVRGRNLYPQDIEGSAERSHPALRHGCSAAFGVELEDGEEHLVIVAEVRGQPTAEELQAAIEAIKSAVSQEHQLRCHGVLLLKEKTVPKTTSGKIQRRACKQGFVEWGQSQTKPAPDGGWFRGVKAGLQQMVHKAPVRCLTVVASWVGTQEAEPESVFQDCAEEATGFAAGPQDEMSTDGFAAGPEDVVHMDVPGNKTHGIQSGMRRLVQSGVHSIVQHQIGQAITVDESLEEAGIESMDAIEITSMLQKEFGELVRVPQTVLLDHPTIRSSSEYLYSCLAPSCFEFFSVECAKAWS